MDKREYVIDGAVFSTLEEFYAEISRKLIPGVEWGHNLDAFNDILRGGFGTPEGGFVLRWTNAQTSRDRLGYPETVRQLERRLQECHPTNHEHVRKELERAQRRDGQTVFDWIVEIVRDHGPAGDEADDGIDLILD